MGTPTRTAVHGIWLRPLPALTNRSPWSSNARRAGHRRAAESRLRPRSCKRAAALTQDRARRTDRELAAAEASLQAGAFDVALGLLTTADAGPLDEFQRARIDLLRAQIAFASSRGTEATPLLLAAAHRLEPLDISLARETYVDAFSAALFGARLNEGVGLPEVAQAARVAPRRSDGESGTADLLLDALVALADDYDAAIPPSREALAAALRREDLARGEAALVVAGVRSRP